MPLAKRSIDYVDQLNLVNNKICKLYKQQRLFFSEQTGFPSYHKVRGNNHADIPDNLPLEQYKTWPVQNAPWHDLDTAVRASERLGGILLSPARDKRLVVLSREYMLEGSTLPIRVTYRISNERKNTHITSLFVKQINLNRIFLGTLYSLALGEMPQTAFSESSVVEREVWGRSIIEQYNKNHSLLSNQFFKRELVRLNVIAHFVSVDDMDNGANVVVDAYGRWRVIDFHQGFWEPVADPRVKLINPFVYKIRINNHVRKEEFISLPDEKLRSHFKSNELEEMVRQEMRRVSWNIGKNIPLFYRVIDAMSDIEYYNHAAQELYNAENVAGYFLYRLNQFRREGTKAP